MIVANYLFKEKKKSIKKEINDLISFLEEKYRKLDEREKNFVRFLSKHIIFFKNFSDLENNFEIKLLISDFYYFIISYLNLEGRYVALNLRSIIENYIRLLLNKVSEEYHIEHNSFIELKEKYNLSNDDNSLVYDTYIKSNLANGLAYIYDKNQGSRRLKGGYWDISDYFCAIIDRNSVSNSARSNEIGFRIVRTV